MATSAATVGRPADRTNLIVRELRSQIVAGVLAPGAQLPTRAEIEESFGAGANTVQRALESLRRDGFIEVNGRFGTFVSETPPHLTNYALVFPGNPSNASPWTRFWTALSNEARSNPGGANVRIDQYFDINQHRDNEDYLRLLQEVTAHRLAGIIFSTDPYLVDDTPLVTQPGIKRVAIMGRPRLENFSVVHPDVGAFWQRAAEYLASRGRKRVAILLPNNMPVGLPRAPRSYIEEANLLIHPYWIQGLDIRSPEYAANAAHLLFHPNQTERPDALIVADDNFVEYATQGLIASGVRVPEEVEVVAHCNYPWPTPSVLPTKRLGYDARQVLNECIQCLKTQDPNNIGDAIQVAPLFEEEFEASRPTSEGNKRN